MPCRDYTYEEEGDANRRRDERERRVKKLAEYVSKSLLLKNVVRDNLDENTRFLCSTIKGMKKWQLDKIVYDGHNKTARDLADWWEDHQERDRAREKEEEEKARVRRVRKNALAKLTDEERKVLGV